MGKDFKEKYERVCSVKDKAISLVETQLNGNIENVDAKELGEVADIAKDFAEIMKLCCEAEYYYKVTEAMDEGSDEEKKYYLNKYIPEYEGKFYTPMYARQRDSRGRYMYTEPEMMVHDDRYDDAYRNRMYYSSMTDGGRSNTGMHNAMDGRSYISRRGYMEAKERHADEKTKVDEIKKWASDFTEDVAEMLKDASAEERKVLKQHLNDLVTKIA